MHSVPPQHTSHWLYKYSRRNVGHSRPEKNSRSLPVQARVHRCDEVVPALLCLLLVLSEHETGTQHATNNNNKQNIQPQGEKNHHTNIKHTGSP